MSSDKKKGGRMIDPFAQKPPRVIDPYSQDSLPARSDAARKTEKEQRVKEIDAQPIEPARRLARLSGD